MASSQIAKECEGPSYMACFVCFVKDGRHPGRCLPLQLDVGCIPLIRTEGCKLYNPCMSEHVSVCVCVYVCVCVRARACICVYVCVLSLCVSACVCISVYTLLPVVHRL